MSATEKTLGVIKSVFLYQEAMKAVREDMKALSIDIAALGRAHSGLAERVARIEGMIEGVTAGRSQRRLPRDDEGR